MLRTLTLVAMLASVAGAQADSGSARSGAQQGPLLHSADDLVLHSYTAKHVYPGDLADTVEQLYGRRVFVTEHGGLSGPPVINVRRLGDSVVLYDTEDSVARMLEALEVLDAAPNASGTRSGSNLTTFAYSPRYASISSIERSLVPFRRNVFHGNAQVANISVVPDRRQIIVRDDPATLEDIRELIEQVDQPDPQVTITVMILRGTREPTEGTLGLPEDLTSNLSAMLPYDHFEQLSMGVVRASVADGSAVTMANEVPRDSDTFYEIMMSLQAYDATQNMLTIGGCQVSGPYGVAFSTATSVREGEYTVLGAGGSEPVFVVLRLLATPQGEMR